MDEVFRALNDPSRRLLLDRLFARDGQSLGELCAHLPEMTRFGVMNHLSVLEAADLVVTRKQGRTKLHYLNPVPIRVVYDRWIDKYTEPWVGALAHLKGRLEQGGTGMDKPDHIYQTYIDCTPEAAWNAIVDGDLTVQYFYGTRVESEWKPGTAIRYLSADGSVVADGEILSCDPPKRLEMTFVARWDPALEAEGAVREVWLVEPADRATKLVVELYDMAPGTKRYDDFVHGIPFIVAGMKTLLETGRPLGSQ